MWLAGTAAETADLAKRKYNIGEGRKVKGEQKAKMFAM